MLKIICKMNPLITKNQNQTRRGNKTEIHRFWLVWVHWGALAHFFRRGNHLIQSLAEAFDTITNTISNDQGALYNISSYRESMRQYYSNGLSYKDIENLKITKDQLFSLFWDPSTRLVLPANQAPISIDWCREPNIKANWMDRCYMVFDEDPHGNRDIPFYFLRKLYVEFIPGKPINYFDI